METRPEESSPPAIDFLDPVAGWEAAARWNRATFDWMAKGWQQWLALVTTMPQQMGARSVLAPPAESDGERALARSSAALESRVRGNDGDARKRKPKATAKKAAKRSKTRSRG